MQEQPFSQASHSTTVRGLEQLTRERRARKLLSVEAVVAPLRVVLPVGEGAGTAGVLASELIAKAALVLKRDFRGR